MFQIKVVDKIKTHVLCSETFSRKWCRLWDNVETCGGAREAEDDYGEFSLLAWLVRLHSRKHAPSHQQALTHMRSLTRAHMHTYTHTNTQKCVILIAFPLQKWFGERASMLRYTYIASLVYVAHIYHCRVVNPTFDKMSSLCVPSVCQFAPLYLCDRRRVANWPSNWCYPAWRLLCSRRTFFKRQEITQSL
jgi:hypothetical protein